MKKKILLISFMVTMVLMLVACGNKAHSLNGSYTVSTMGIDTTYTFDKDENVEVKIECAGYIAVDQKGTYKLNEDKTEITLTFPEIDKTIGDFIYTIPAYDGTFTFSQDDTSITIGNIKYTVEYK